MGKSMAYPNPLMSFRYIIEIEKAGETTAAAAFLSFSGVKMRVDAMKVRTGAEPRGVMDAYPVLTQFENVTFTRGVVGDLSFLEWILSAAPDDSRAATGRSYADKYRDISVSALNEAGKRAITWTLVRALPVAYDLGEMQGSQSALLTESVEFMINGFRREVNEESFNSAQSDLDRIRNALHGKYAGLRGGR
jgi:phage tail-like protein